MPFGLSTRSLLVGLVIGASSTLYPRLPQYLPTSVSAYLPFLPATAPASSWSGTYAAFQSSAPVTGGYAVGSEAEREADEERALRMQDPKERDKLLKKLEARTETAGEENAQGPETPVYLMDRTTLGSGAGRMEMETIGRGVLQSGAGTVVLVLPGDADGLSLSIPELPSKFPLSTGPIGSTTLLDRLTYLLTASPLASYTFNPVPDLTKEGLAILEAIFPAPATGREKLPGVVLVQVGKSSVPALAEAGAALRHLRDEGATLVLFGSLPPPSKALRKSLTDLTLHARESALARLLAPIARKVSNFQKEEAVTYLAAAAGASSPGESRADGLGWRFGDWVKEVPPKEEPVADAEAVA